MTVAVTMSAWAAGEGLREVATVSVVEAATRVTVTATDDEMCIRDRIGADRERRPALRRPVAPGTGRRTPDATGLAESGAGGWLTLRLSRRDPFAAAPLLSFLSVRAIPGVESATAGGYTRALRTPGGIALVLLTPGEGHVLLRLRLDDLADLEGVVRRCRRLLDLDSDPAAVAAGLGRDPMLDRLVAGLPGMRVPGSAEPFETAVRAVLGQQVSVAAARTLAARLVERHGDPLPSPFGGVTHLFPSPERLAGADLDLSLIHICSADYLYADNGSYATIDHFIQNVFIPPRCV